MRLLCCLLICFLSGQLAASTKAPVAADPSQAWHDLQSKREALKSFHQEFATTRTFKTAPNHEQTLTRTVILDCAGGRWRERSVSGGGESVKVFDGKDWFQFESGGDEHVRLTPSKDESPQPGPYSTAHLEFSKAVERERRSCGLKNVDHECVTIDIPVKSWVRTSGSTTTRVLNGTARFSFDAVSGLLIFSRLFQNLDDGHGGYQADTIYALKQMSYNADLEESLFRLPPSAAREVKELPRWDANKIQKELAGNAAPDFTLTDMQGKTVRSSDLKGKTVLLDFWATWCGPCRADAPSLDRLHHTYGGKNLVIIGVDVDEERPIVQTFLIEHPHQYPIVLTTENEMPRPFQIGVYPTYVVIDSNGNLVSATEGDKSFSDLRRMLKKAGLDTE